MFNANMLHYIADPNESFLRALFVANDRYKEDMSYVPSKGQVDYFTNLATGVMQTVMARFSSAKGLLAECKGYCSASEFWRFDIPYDDTAYTIAGLPTEKFASFASLSSLEVTALLRKYVKRLYALLNSIGINIMF